MPVYEYLCTGCGSDYTLLRPMSERNDPSNCPLCKQKGVKVVLTAPRCATLARSTRIAHETNERSRHEPQTLDQYKSKRHKPGCGCCSNKNTQRKNPDGTLAPKTAGRRPWMISH